MKAVAGEVIDNKDNDAGDGRKKGYLDPPGRLRFRCIALVHWAVFLLPKLRDWKGTGLTKAGKDFAKLAILYLSGSIGIWIWR